MNKAIQIMKTIDSIPIDSKSVIVYDIDGTLIDTSGNPIDHIVHTYRYAVSKGLKPVIITARKSTDPNIHYTIKQLQNHIDGKLMVYFLPEHSGQTAEHQANYKLLARQHLHTQGYVVKISLGDMPWDVGQYGGIGFIV